MDITLLQNVLGLVALIISFQPLGKRGDVISFDFQGICLGCTPEITNRKEIEIRPVFAKWLPFVDGLQRSLKALSFEFPRNGLDTFRISTASLMISVQAEQHILNRCQSMFFERYIR